MKTMNNFIISAVASIVLAGAEAKADFMQCIWCPAGYRCDGYSNYLCPAGTFATGGASSCTPCPSGYVSSAGSSSCRPSENNPDAWELLYNKTEGEGTATLNAGTYIVSLHGGNGGSSKRGNGPLGGSVTYKFTVNSSWTFKYGVGQNAPDGSSNIFCNAWTEYTGGGGGSWISINDQYIVAGGGGGLNLNPQVSTDAVFNTYSFGITGGSGGAVGAGSSMVIYDSGFGYDYNHNVFMKPENIAKCVGGNSGNYSNNIMVYTFYQNLGAEGSEADYGLYCYAGQGINSNNGAKCQNSMSDRATTPGNTGGLNLYSGGTNTQVGGSAGHAGSATHSSNVSISGLACGTSSGCVKLYKFKY